MKAILVIDMPNNCSECPCCNENLCGNQYKGYIDDYLEWNSGRPSWCQLRPVHALKSGGHDYIIYERQYLYDNLEREFELLQKARDWEKQNESTDRN